MYHSFIVGTPKISEIIQKIAFENGYHWSNDKPKVVQYTDRPVLSFYNEKEYKNIYYTSFIKDLQDNEDEHIILNTITELLEFLQYENILINKNKVIFNNDKSITVGCTTIPFDIISKIWNRCNK